MAAMGMLIYGGQGRCNMPIVGTVEKEKARPSFHLGHTFCVYEFVLSVYELSHVAISEDGVKSHQFGRGSVGFTQNPKFFLLLLLLVK